MNRSLDAVTSPEPLIHCLPMQRLAVLLVLGLVAGACGTGTDVAGDGDPSSSSTTSTTTSVPGPATTEGTSSPNSDGTTTMTQAPLPPLDGPSAPDFSLQLSDGSTFMLSEEARPVYMVFWAEW